MGTGILPRMDPTTLPGDAGRVAAQGRGAHRDGREDGRENWMLGRLRQLIRNHHSSALASGVAAACQKFLRAFYNEGFYDFRCNGEGRVLRILGRNSPEPIVFDVGAHSGGWTAELLAEIPGASVHCFEIVPALCDQLRANVSRRDNVTVHPFGLSSRATVTEMTYNKTYTTTSSITPSEEGAFFQDADTEVIEVRVEAGDDVVERLGLQRLDLLKIDVEGHEVDVFQGFERTFESPIAPRVIQFEYGSTYLPARRTLKDVYERLAPHGYAIGRIYPRCVEFQEYRVDDDHFRMGNYLAVKADDALKASLESDPS